MKTIKKGQKVKKGKGIVDRTKDLSHPPQSEILFKKGMYKILAIDPGKAGAFVLFDGQEFESWPMPFEREGKDDVVSFAGVSELLRLVLGRFDTGSVHVYLERAISFGMGTKGAFNYGRGFAALEIAIGLHRAPVTYTEPAKWTKEMHAGISGDLKPKAKSLIAVKRLYPQLVDKLPRAPKGKLLDGVVDALLIAGYGLRQQGVPDRVAQEQDEREAESENMDEYDFM